MNFLKTSLVYSISKRSLSGATALHSMHLVRDWKPGKYPKTEEERLAAAKKYNLFPEEYEPVKDNGNGAGDYPGFKPYSVESRDLFYPWDYPEYRRNYGESWHEDMNMYGEERVDVTAKLRYPLPLMFATFLLAMGSSVFLTYYCKDTAFLPAMPHHLPSPGVKHYTYQ